MPPKREALRWAAYAEEDYEYAQLGLTRYPRNATWDFHQAAEKYLKAALLEENIEPPRTHDLLRLLSLLKQLSQLLSLNHADIITECAC